MKLPGVKTPEEVGAAIRLIMDVLPDDEARLACLLSAKVCFGCGANLEDDVGVCRDCAGDGKDSDA